MLRVGSVGLSRLFFCTGKKLATPLEFAEPQIGVEEDSPSVWQYLLAVREEIRAARFCSSVAIMATIPIRMLVHRVISRRHTDLDESEK
jgi:hypothetical protein